MYSILSSHGMVLATAMVVSGTVLLLAFRLQKSQLPITQQVSRPCLSSSSDGRKRKKSKKRVHFSKDVVEPRGDGKEFRRQNISSGSGGSNIVDNSCQSPSPNVKKVLVIGGVKHKEMPANRVALYNGILKDRVIQRLACSY